MENAVAERPTETPPRGQEPPGDLNVSLKTEAGRICLSASLGSESVRLSLISDAPSVEMMPETLAAAGRVMQEFADAVRERKVISRAALDLVGAAMGDAAPAGQDAAANTQEPGDDLRVHPGVELLLEAIADPHRGQSVQLCTSMIQGYLNALNQDQKLRDRDHRRRFTTKSLKSIISIAYGQMLDLHA